VPELAAVHRRDRQAVVSIRFSILRFRRRFKLENTDIKVNLVSPAFTATDLNNFAGVESIEDGSREVVRVALFGPDGPNGTFTVWENEDVRW
jgi:hypothetical protein